MIIPVMIAAVSLKLPSLSFDSSSKASRSLLYDSVLGPNYRCDCRGREVGWGARHCFDDFDASSHNPNVGGSWRTTDGRCS